MLPRSPRGVALPTATGEALRAHPRRGHGGRDRAGDRPVHRGTPDHDFFVILEGEVRATKLVRGEEQLLTVHGPGNFTGEISMLTGGLALATGRASGPCRVIRVAPDRFRRLIAEQPAVARVVLTAHGRPGHRRRRPAPPAGEDGRPRQAVGRPRPRAQQPGRRRRAVGGAAPRIPALLAEPDPGARPPVHRARSGRRCSRSSGRRSSAIAHRRRAAAVDPMAQSDLRGLADRVAGGAQRRGRLAPRPHPRRRRARPRAADRDRRARSATSPCAASSPGSRGCSTWPSCWIRWSRAPAASPSW